MATKKELEAEIAELKTIIQGLGGDPALGLEDYIRIGAYHYPKTAAVTLKWSGEYCEFESDNSFYLEEHGESMMARLKAWGLTEDEEDLLDYVQTSKIDSRTVIQAKIEQSWSSLSALMSECRVADIYLADEMYIELSLGKVNVRGFGLTVEKERKRLKKERYKALQTLSVYLNFESLFCKEEPFRWVPCRAMMGLGVMRNLVMK